MKLKDDAIYKGVNDSKKIFRVQNPDGTFRIKVQSVNPKGLQTMTNQQFKDDADPNNLMKKYSMNQLPNVQGLYMDNTNLPDLPTALATLNHANETFMALPAKVRERFANDPQKMIEFLSDKENEAEGLKLGLLRKKEVPVDPNKPLIDAINENTKTINATKTKKRDQTPDLD